jgi:hypothetical protein
MAAARLVVPVVVLPALAACRCADALPGRAIGIDSSDRATSAVAARPGIDHPGIAFDSWVMVREPEQMRDSIDPNHYDAAPTDCPNADPSVALYHAASRRSTWVDVDSSEPVRAR